MLHCVAPRIVEEAIAQAGGWKPDDSDMYCARCGVTRNGAAVEAWMEGGCALCRSLDLPWTRLTRLCRYGEPESLWLRSMKFQRQWAWAHWFGERMAEALPAPACERGAGEPVVVPVPMPWRRRWWRGFNQSALIADVVSRRRGWAVCPVLHRLHHTPPQTRVAPHDRPANVANSFGIAHVDLQRRPIVLIDDVKTTGSTLSACAKLLRSAGGGAVYVGVVAVAERAVRDENAELDA